jgi:preprotein translocase SecE subunit
MSKRLKEYLVLVFITITLLLTTTVLKYDRSSLYLLIIIVSLVALSFYKNMKLIISIMSDILKETKTITWSTKKATIQTSGLVICVIISLCLVFWCVDNLTLFLLKNFY